MSSVASNYGKAASVRVFRKMRGQNFDGDRTVEPCVPRAINLAPPSPVPNLIRRFVRFRLPFPARLDRPFCVAFSAPSGRKARRPGAILSGCNPAAKS
jgi:hypothetical protein